jgi:hypothetical protein
MWIAENRPKEITMNTNTEAREQLDPNAKKGDHNDNFKTSLLA